jgi:hypothetical protein
MSYASDHQRPQPCCDAGPDGKALWWRDRIASVTTLSTPHRGSAFADWGLRFLDDGDDKKGVKESYLGMKMMGFFQAEHKTPDQVLEDATNTFYNLSSKFTEEMSQYSEIDKQRIYSWYCALGSPIHCDGATSESTIFDSEAYPYPEERAKVQPPGPQDWPQRRDDPRCAHLPEIANGTPQIEAADEYALARELTARSDCYKLPGPKLGAEHGMPPIFSWAGRSCPGGPAGGPPCGDILTPALEAMFGVMTREEGYNDGIVSVHSARFGLFMWVQPVDHMNWTAMEGISAHVYGAVTGKKPIEFYFEWLPRLQEAGY